MRKDIRVIIVEDSLFLKEMLCHIFAEAGIHVVGLASSGGEALSKIETLKPDLVLLDLVLPGQSGITLMKKIHHFYSETKVVVCSSLQHEKFVSDSELAGAVDFINKPFKSDEIVEAVFSAVGEEEQEQKIMAA